MRSKHKNSTTKDDSDDDQDDESDEEGADDEIVTFAMNASFCVDPDGRLLTATVGKSVEIVKDGNRQNALDEYHQTTFGGFQNKKYKKKKIK